MDLIFHEKQEGCLCAQHCLNALLQGAYFTPVDLATLAQQMDEQERERMAESGVDSEEYRQFIEQPSGNMDDSGYFSVQVITSALNVWNLELVPYNSSEPRALEAQKAPQNMQAYICNYREHWFTIRRLGCQWFNLNSMLTGPQLISDTYLSIYLAQLQHEGYSIFLVFGALPDCQAHEVLMVSPVVQSAQPKPVEISKRSQGHRLGSTADDPDLQKAISLSLGQTNDAASETPEHVLNEDDSDDDLQRALRESMQDTTSKENIDFHESVKDPIESIKNGDNNENDFKRALQMSLECIENDHASNTSRSSSLDLSEIRARRLRYLEGTNAQSASKSSST